METMLNYLPIREQEEVNPEKPGDYIDDTGLLVCGVCGQRKQYRTILPFSDIEITVPVICYCKEKELKDEMDKKQYEEKLRRIEEIREASLIPGELKNAKFSEYICRAENKRAYTVANNYVDNWETVKASGEGIIFYGGVGTGKSYTAACIANALMEQEVAVLMTSFVKILQALRQDGTNEEAYGKAIESVDLLIIDDLGAERDTAYAQEKVYNVIDSRLRTGKPMILTTNLTAQELKNPDGIGYERIYDRVMKACYPVEIAGKSMRRQEAGRRFESMRSILERPREEL